MKDYVEVLESYMIVEEGLFSRSKNKTKEDRSEPINRSIKISYADYKSQYEPKIKKMLALCKSELSKVFKDSANEKYHGSFIMYSDTRYGDIPIVKQFPYIIVISYNISRIDNDSFSDLSPKERKPREESVKMVLNMINTCAAKAGLNGKAIDNRDTNYIGRAGTVNFVIDCNYSGVESDN